MVPRWLRSGWRVPARCSGSLKRVVVKRATLWLAGFGSEFGRDGCYFRPLAQAALASKTRSAVAVGLIMSHTWAISGPLRSASAGHRAITLGECRSSGHYARRVPVIHGQPRAHRNDSVAAWRRNGRDLPSWPCEFDSRHPLQIIAPSQLTFSVAQTIRTSTWQGVGFFRVAERVALAQREIAIGGPRAGSQGVGRTDRLS
jgi:hypothetical protein